MSHLQFSRRDALNALAASAALPLVSTSGLAWAKPASEAEANALLESIGNNLLATNPEYATALGLDVGARAKMRYQMEDRSPAGRRRLAATLKADLARAEALDTPALSFPVRTSVEVVKSAYTTALEGFALPYGDVAVGGWRNTPYVVIQNVGAYIDTPQFLDTDHPIENRDDAEAYLSRLAEYPAQLDGELVRMKEARAKGLVPPNFLIDKALTQLDISLKGTQQGGTIVDSLVKRTKDKNIAGDWDVRARKIAVEQVAPALQRQIDELKAERAVATDVAGMWSRPHGDEYYRWALKASTTTNMSPDEVHKMGLEQLAELHGRMDPILKSLGYTQGTIGERMQALAKDPRYKFSEGDKGREEIKAYIAERIDKIRAVLPRGFNTLVPGHLEVRRMSPEQEPGAPGAYGGAGSIDGKIPGKFWINLRSTDLHSKYSLPDLAAHEAIPGHVWQGEYANKLPLIRTLLAFNAYSEGWALYAEQLVDELGVYDDFPVGRLGYLQSIAFRCCRLVVDSGLHAKRWTRQQGVDFFVQRNGSNPLEVASEVDRYCSWPGQACGYKVGHSTINRLRDKAKAELGAKYDLRAYDDAVVLGGNVPMDVLAKNVDDYIARTKSKA
ncbi:DUF885 domain-containing protein [Sphingomonas sp. SM33]|uniref:DUF885 domain-containing protein n=1 Tax=Sphingomonas telluris TaxID=2907998 RepID=A0ABS9VJQ7_9SPHN|nr:DUF885 domain-containing protein [Sphingomonas telluris]MCH8615223.1 DUF885 domain-containing protein [Sphingomonas telluris]